MTKHLTPADIKVVTRHCFTCGTNFDPVTFREQCPNCIPRAPEPTTEPIKSVALEAHELVHGDRRQTYGHPKANHARTAALWSAYLGIEITPRQVCMLNALQKISRDAHAPKRDNLIDICGYAENAQLCEDP